MVPRTRAFSSTLAISLIAAVLGTIAVSSLLSKRVASVLVQSWTEADEASVERLVRASPRQLQMLAVSPKPLGTFSDDC